MMSLKLRSDRLHTDQDERGEREGGRRKERGREEGGKREKWRITSIHNKFEPHKLSSMRY